MATRYLICKCRDVETGASFVQQDLTGTRFTLAQRALAEDKAAQFAETRTRNTGRLHTPFVEEYTPSVRRN